MIILRFKGAALIGLISLLASVFPSMLTAQPLQLPQQQRPNQERPVMPKFEEPDSTPFVLPPVLPLPEDTGQLSSSLKVFVKKIRLHGNSVFSDEELGRITQNYEGRVITSEELQEVRRKITLHYVDRGYVNSGAIIPDQKVEDGILDFTIIEGRLAGIEIQENRWLKTDYIKKRLALGSEEVLNVNQLRQRLQLLQQNPVVQQSHANLRPGPSRLGEGILQVQIREENPLEAGLVFANDRSPSVGAERFQVYVAHRSLTGWSDTLSLQYGNAEGADDYSVYYSRPVNAYDTTLRLGYDQSMSVIVEEPFDSLDIESELKTYHFSLTHPFYRTPQKQFSLGLAFERRQSQTFLMGMPFSFSAGVQNGESEVTVVRFFQDWLGRSLNHVLAARSTFSLGIDALGATIGPEPDGQFFTWLGQFQWVSRLNQRGDQVIFRTDLQLADEEILPLERIAIGGATTVRGYRENQLVRDNAVITSLEFRIPIFRLPIPKISSTPEDGIVQLAPFGDLAWGWNNKGETPDPTSISSVGLGLRWAPSRKIYSEIYWGYALKDISTTNYDLQDDGIHFRISCYF